MVECILKRHAQFEVYASVKIVTALDSAFRKDIEAAAEPIVVLRTKLDEQMIQVCEF